MNYLRRSSPALYPETILQFGTGRFLRGFADFFVHRGQSTGTYHGSICAVQTTGKSRANALANQDGCYTLWVRDKDRDSPEVIGSISRALVASDDWEEIIRLSKSHDLRLIFSNTTEVGLTLDVNDHVMRNPPESFPGKLTRVLLERGIHFQYSADKGLIILPCELVENNGDLLKSLVLKIAQQQDLPRDFVRWVEDHNIFCNTLVDRIVPGTPPESDLDEMETRLGFRDPMMITAETYRLWAIEGPQSLGANLGFAAKEPAIIITPDISPFRLRKVRILNGGHTLSVPLGLLAGNRTVLDNMTNPETRLYIVNLLREEIGATLEVDPSTIGPYIDEVLQRWQNPFLVHRLIDITFQSTTKMLHRVVPSILSYYARFNRAPQRIALGFAAYLLFMKGHRKMSDTIYTLWDNSSFPVNDDQAPYFRDLWQKFPQVPDLVHTVSRNTRLWETDLSSLPDWVNTVTSLMQRIQSYGVATTIGHMEEASSLQRKP